MTQPNLPHNKHNPNHELWNTCGNHLKNERIKNELIKKRTDPVFYGYENGGYENEGYEKCRVMKM